jgi:hypothetical protein
MAEEMGISMDRFDVVRRAMALAAHSTDNTPALSGESSYHSLPFSPTSPVLHFKCHRNTEIPFLGVSTQTLYCLMYLPVFYLFQRALVLLYASMRRHGRGLSSRVHRAGTLNIPLFLSITPIVTSITHIVTSITHIVTSITPSVPLSPLLLP